MLAMVKYVELTDEELAVVDFDNVHDYLPGLTETEASDRLVKFGRNEIPEEKEPLWKMFAMQVRSPRRDSGGGAAERSVCECESGSTAPSELPQRSTRRRVCIQR